MVLRRWVGELREEGPENVRREARVLAGLAATGVPAPRLLAADPDGHGCGDAALLMTRLPGRIQLNPADPERWIGEMATMLARIHDATVAAPKAESWLDELPLEVPIWTRRPGLWRQAIDLVRGAAPAVESCFIHRDYHQFNLLWTGDRLTGVVDWVEASCGSADIDVAHCRLNLAVLYSAGHAERFRLAYQAITGRAVDRWWDVAGLLVYLPGWGEFLQRQAGPTMKVDFAGMHERVEQVLQAALGRS